MATQDTTISKYLLTRLKQVGVDDIFGVPGDFGLGFFDVIMESDLRYVGTCNELNCGYAADGYARVKGIGAMAVTYAVGELSAVNAIAGAFAERVPVVMIVGTPPTEALKTEPLLHHTLGKYDKTFKIFQEITVAQTILDSEDSAPKEIDRVLATCLKEQRPVYIQLPADKVFSPCEAPQNPLRVFPASFQFAEETLSEAVDEASKLINNAKNPIFLADVELIRYRAQKEFAELLDVSNIPFACLMMGKTVLSEDHPLYVGLYQGNRSREYVRKRVETSDCVIELGVFLSDLNTGGFTVSIPNNRVIRVAQNQVWISNHCFHGIPLRVFIDVLKKKLNKRDPKDLDIHRATDSCIHRPAETFQPRPNQKLCTSRIFDRLAHFFPDNSIIVADIGQCLFSTAETLLPKNCTFITQVFYGSIGYSVGACLGAAIAAPNRPVILLVGDGAFQETCQEISTLVREKCRVVVLLLNNEGYLIERCIDDGPYNDLQNWNYSLFPKVVGAQGKTFNAFNEGELEESLKHAEQILKENKKELTFIEMHTDRWDCSQTMRDAGHSMAQVNHIPPKQRTYSKKQSS